MKSSQKQINIEECVAVEWRSINNTMVRNQNGWISFEKLLLLLDDDNIIMGCDTNGLVLDTYTYTGNVIVVYPYKLLWMINNNNNSHDPLWPFYPHPFSKTNTTNECAWYCYSGGDIL